MNDLHANDRKYTFSIEYQGGPEIERTWTYNLHTTPMLVALDLMRNCRDIERITVTNDDGTRYDQWERPISGTPGAKDQTMNQYTIYTDEYSTWFEADDRESAFANFRHWVNKGNHPGKRITMTEQPVGRSIRPVVIANAIGEEPTS